MWREDNVASMLPPPASHSLLELLVRIPVAKVGVIHGIMVLLAVVYKRPSLDEALATGARVQLYPHKPR